MAITQHGIHYSGEHLFIRYRYRSESGKTKIFDVHELDGNGHLGVVKWFGRWRKYAFFPREESVFEETCMRDLSDFCVAETKRFRQGYTE